MPRAEMLSRMSSRELTGWMAYHAIEPFGGDVQYIGHAITATVIANGNRKKGTKPHKPADFLPRWESGEQSPDEMLSIAAMYTAALGGDDMREDNADG